MLHTECQYVLIISKEWKGNKTCKLLISTGKKLLISESSIRSKSVRHSLREAASFMDLGILLDQIKTVL